MKKARTATGLAALYARLDQIRMSQAERESAKAALAQADAMAGFFLGTVNLAKRLVASPSGHAHTRA